MRAPALLCLGLFLWAVPAAHAQDAPPTVDASIGHVDVTLDLPKDVPHVGEMILLRVRTTIRGDVALDSLRQPPFTNFDWQQLGRDKPIRVMADGFNVPGFERDIAIFPQQAGRLIIEPFVRHVTMVVGTTGRVQADFSSKPVFVDVQRNEGVNTPGTWWLPAKAVRLTQTWSPRPDEIEPGKVARRIVTLEAVGLPADRLPPPPTLRAPGLITFTGPATRETALTADGPVARATYQWDVRPVSNSPAKLPAIRVAWFDTGERRMREAVLADEWVGYAGLGGAARRVADGSLLAQLTQPGPALAGAAGFVWAAALAGLLLAPRSGRRAGLMPARALRPLRRAARRGDPAAFKAVLTTLARAHPRRWRHCAADADVAADLSRLDAHLYGREAGAGPSLKVLAARIARAWRMGDPAEEAPPGSLPLDALLAARADLTSGAQKPQPRPPGWAMSGGMRAWLRQIGV